MADRRGRPARPGERTASGLRRESDLAGIGAIWRRLADEAGNANRDPRYASQIARLRVQRELTETQATAADLVGRIYGRYERLNGLHRSCRSPSYQFSTGHGDERLADPDWAGQVRRDFRDLQDCIPRQARDIVEQLCVEDRHVPAIFLPDLRTVLDRVAAAFWLAAQSDGGLPALKPVRYRKPRQSRLERFEAGAYAAGAPVTRPSALAGEAAAAAAHDRAALVRQLEQRNETRAPEQADAPDGDAPR